MIALISSNYNVKNHLAEIINNIPQVKVFNTNDEEMRNELNYDQFKQFCFCSFEITVYTKMKLQKYAPEKIIEFSNLYSMKNYLKNSLN